jgi:hypothetical protein
LRATLRPCGTIAPHGEITRRGDVIDNRLWRILFGLALLLAVAALLMGCGVWVSIAADLNLLGGGA